MHKIVSVSAGKDYILNITYENGVQIQADISRLIDIGGVFSILAQREVFESVHVGVRGRSIVFTEDLDLDPDVFFMEDTDPNKPSYIQTISRTDIGNPISLRLRELVEASNLSQADIAKRAGMPQQSLSRLLDPNYAGHTVSSVQRVAAVLGQELRLQAIS